MNRQTQRASHSIVLLSIAACMVAMFSNTTSAQNDSERKPTPDELKQLQAIQKQGEEMGSWDEQYLIMGQATETIFDQHGWDSESDEYARGLVQEVGRVPFWKPQERQQIFMNSLQGRYQLSETQKTQLDGWVKHEAIMTTARHFKEIAPIAMEAVRARAEGKPFTPEQVQKWSKSIEPMMGDILSATERVTEKLKKTMTPEQQAMLDADMKALKRRHEDMLKDVQRWKEGKWTPMDWGLQSDPIHAQAILKYEAQDARRNQLVEQTQMSKPLDEGVNASNESEWDLYVKRFCHQFECTDEQRTQAEAILKDSKRQAIEYRLARKDRIELAEQTLAKAATPESKQVAQADLDKQLKQIGFIFDRMKKRLYSQVLTSEQQAKFPNALKEVQSKSKK